LILTDILHLLSRNPVRPAMLAPPDDARPMRRESELQWITHPGRIAHIGHTGGGFAFDNEGPRHRAWLEAFALASRPVTNGEFLAFIDDGGYRRPELWLALGWDAVSAHGWAAPLYWEHADGCWATFTLHGMADIDPAAPVRHISLFEADAYARWAGARLPTEYEWEAIATRAPGEASTAPIGHGDVWEWTSSSYAPYPGFRPAPGAVGEYNGKFMCNQYVLRGGSAATPPGHARVTYRNFFPPDARWQWSGVRLARTVSG
jgi:ergothioneine biosynthesis protein EgtB